LTYFWMAFDWLERMVRVILPMCGAGPIRISSYRPTDLFIEPVTNTSEF
jgi:hypothetical protein